QPIYVDEPTIEETIEILKGIKQPYEDHHNLEITDEAIESAAQLSARYVPDRFLPDKAIDLIDEGASRVRMYKSPEAIRVRHAEAELQDITTELEELGGDMTDEQRQELKARESELGTQLTQWKSGWNPETNKPRLTAEDIAEVVSMWTGIP